MNVYVEKILPTVGKMRENNNMTQMDNLWMSAASNYVNKDLLSLCYWEKVSLWTPSFNYWEI